MCICSDALYNSTRNQLYPNHYFTIIIIVQQIKSSQMVFDERGKLEYPGKNLSEQSREPTNSIHIWCWVRKLNPGHIGGSQVLSPKGQPCRRRMLLFKVSHMQCSPQILTQQVGDNSCPVLFKTTCIVLVNLQKVAGGKKFLELLLGAVNFTGYRLIRRTLHMVSSLIPFDFNVPRTECCCLMICPTGSGHKS